MLIQKTVYLFKLFLTLLMLVRSDNPKVDIFGANLFNIFLQTIPEEAWTSIIERVNAMVQKEHLCLFSDSSTSLENPWGLSDFGINEPEWISLIQHPEADPEVLRRLIKRKLKRHPNCSMEPVLVMSGVYQVNLFTNIQLYHFEVSLIITFQRKIYDHCCTPMVTFGWLSASVTI